MTETADYIQTVKAQQDAAAPDISAFVSANAGSGKTRVLTNRVARLLLRDTPPNKILCITFTKAAAAEMSDRLFKLLGDWALADDEMLNKNLNDLEGISMSRNAEDLAIARRLFARALETPGGLKIQTIHSFCESVLKRFPLEAGVAPGFDVLEESDAKDLAVQSIEHVARKAATENQAWQEAFNTLSQWLAPERQRDLILDVGFGKRTAFEKLSTKLGGWDALNDQVCNMLGIEPTESKTRIIEKIVASYNKNILELWCETLLTFGGNLEKRGTALKEYFTAHNDEDRWQALHNTFLKSDGAPYSNNYITTAALKKAHPAIAEALDRTKYTIADTAQKIKSIDIANATNALFILGGATAELYKKSKAARASLDFNDLIDHTGQLLSSEATTQWVMYKLDQGIDHILLDEAQDTGPDAWSVIDSFLKEFFAGSAARDLTRTFFAVGDQKQSIYSFQGADALLFNAKQIDLGKKISATSKFQNFPLSLSFRTTQPVLKFVDALFAEASTLNNVSSEATLSHGVFRQGQAGLVELWPLISPADKEDFAPWDMPLDTISEQNPIAQLASQVATTIKGWLKNNEALESKARPIKPGDVMILLQSRSPLYHEMIRALGRERVPIAGPDKMSLLEDQGVLDLLSFMRAVLLLSDDLSLAETLKSPFFGIDDEALFHIAYGRGKKSLWDTLKTKAKNNPAYQEIVSAIQSAQKIARYEGPFSFLNYLLDSGKPSGREKLIQRLTYACLEPINELLQQALNFESRNPRSLQGFLQYITKAEGIISRDADQSSNSVRVMTVHKAKGLESPIVFMLDAGRTPVSAKVGPVLDKIADEHPDLPVLVANTDLATDQTKMAKDKEISLRHDEYRRLLYVAATRAEDRLYICGIKKKKNDKQQSWYQLAQAAFDRLGSDVQEGAALWSGHIKRLSNKQTATIEKPTAPKPVQQYPLPPALSQEAKAEITPRRLSPSLLANEIEYDLKGNEIAHAYAPDLPGNALFRGTVLHRLLELLPDIPKPERQTAGITLLARIAPLIDETERAEWCREVIETLETPGFKAAFGPGSMAEVPITGRPKGIRQNIIISGQIDRLIISSEAVLAVDYKTNRPPPMRAEDTPLAYIAQMAAYRALLQEIYPNRPVNCAILWTYEARLMPISAKLMDDAFHHTLA